MERCEQCGLVWNVSEKARLTAGVYVCPVCEAKNRRRTPGGSAGKDRKKMTGGGSDDAF